MIFCDFYAPQENLLYSQNHEHVFPNKDLQC